jgi:tRNA1Val (adenine37-N6)-methyltransferase
VRHGVRNPDPELRSGPESRAARPATEPPGLNLPVTTPESRVPDDSGETVDELRDFELRIIQKRRGYRFSLDPLLLADFCEIGDDERVADLGTGCGVIPLILARKSAGSSFVGVEFQPEMAELAERNVALNGLEARIVIVRNDILCVADHLDAGSFDLVTANPPYRVAGSGKISPTPGRDAARHETTAGLADFLAAAKRLARVDGRISLVYHVSRLPDLLAEARMLKLVPLRLVFVHGSPHAAARMFIIELVKGRRGELKVLPPVFSRESPACAAANIAKKAQI